MAGSILLSRALARATRHRLSLTFKAHALGAIVTCSALTAGIVAAQEAEADSEIKLPALAPGRLSNQSSLLTLDSPAATHRAGSALGAAHSPARERQRLQAELGSGERPVGTGEATNPRVLVAQAGQAPIKLDPISVIGAPARLERIPGSGQVVTEEEIREFTYDDINRVLRRVPGVYVRPEDGYGLFPNISLRGVDTSRSSKVTIMEDGILSAPAPYSDPAAYYTPTVGRMSAIEVLKGTSQIRYGPHITGGVINYISTPIPTEQRVYLKSIYGSDDEVRLHGFTGETFNTDAGKFGYLVEGYFRETDGFKEIDSAPDFRDGEDTGFSNVEPMVKLAWEPATSWYNRFEFKYGRTELDADETYLGLAEGDFRDDPFRRYSSSRFDNIRTEQNRTYLRWFLGPTDDLDIVSTVYYNKFRRNWFKLNDVLDVGGVAGNDQSLSGALAAAGDGLACLRGQLACTLRVRNNAREYYGYGAESVVNYRFETGAVGHELTTGVRWHKDQIDRFQLDELFQQQDNGAISGRALRDPGAAGDRIEETRAIAVFLQDRIEIGKWAFTPGIRYETLDQEFEEDQRRTDADAEPASGSGTLDLLGGGLGVTYTASDRLTLFGGIHRGFSPPSPRDAIGGGLSEETSWGYELGARFNSTRGAFAAETTAFLTQFDDLIVIENIGGTGTGESENVGEVGAYGLEFASAFDAGTAFGWSFSNPYFLSFTLTETEFQTTDASEDPESIFSFAEKGNELPYIPNYQITAGTGLDFTKWGLDLTGTYVDETFTSANNVDEQVDGAGNPDARFGKTDSYLVVDLGAYLTIKEGVRVVGGVQNLLDREYIVSRQPHGPRPGLDRFAFVGLEIDL